MCFSAAASFTTGAALSAIAVVAQREARAPHQRVFASIPALFAVQQLAEGALWLALNAGTNSTAASIFTYVYLSFALVIWPTYGPLSILLFTQGKRAKKTLLALLLLGIAISTYLLVHMILFGAEARIEQHHITYLHTVTDFGLGPWLIVIYGLAAVLPFFVIGDLVFSIYGFLLLLAAAISAFVWYKWFASVWCFFAAILSLGVVFVLHRENRTPSL